MYTSMYGLLIAFYGRSFFIPLKIIYLKLKTMIKHYIVVKLFLGIPFYNKLSIDGEYRTS